MRAVLRHLNLTKHCRDLDVPLWSCPQFLFMVMGGIIIVAIIASYAAAARYTEPEVATMIVIILSALLMVIAYVVEQAFERVVIARRGERERAAELLALKDQFVFIAAHELRAPVTAIRWALEVVEKKNPHAFDASPDSFHALSVNSARLLRLVGDLLQVSRLETGVLKISSEQIDAWEVLRESLEAFREEAGRRGIVLKNDIRADTPHLVADPIRLREVFDNLVSNAIKYNKVGGTVTVGAGSEARSVLFSVSDTGIGFAAEERGRVFEKFWRANRSRRIEGTGLGLFITKNLVELMGGSISFASESGKGTTFFVRLPKATNES